MVVTRPGKDPGLVFLLSLFRRTCGDILTLTTFCMCFVFVHFITERGRKRLATTTPADSFDACPAMASETFVLRHFHLNGLHSCEHVLVHIQDRPSCRHDRQMIATSARVGSRSWWMATPHPGENWHRRFLRPPAALPFPTSVLSAGMVYLARGLILDPAWL